MFEPSAHYTHMDDESDRSPLSFTGSEPRGHHALEQTNYFHPTYQAPYTASTGSHGLRQDVLPPNTWSVDAAIQAHRSTTAPQLDPSSFSQAVTIPLYDSGDSSPHPAYIASSGASPLISRHNLHTVAMPTLIGHVQCGGRLIDAYRSHYEQPFASNDNYMAECYRAIPSPSVVIPMVPAFGAGVSSYTDPAHPSGPAPWQPFHHCTGAFQDFPPSNSLTPSGSLDSESYSSLSPPFSVGNRSLNVSQPETPSGRTQRHPVITTPSDQLYTLTIPLEDVEFPPIYSVEEMFLFQCRWRDCKLWIIPDKEAIKNHLSCTHNVVLKKKSEPACCEWVGCSSTPQWSGLVRHFQTHLGLKWLCSVCKGAYTRPDSVACHTRRESRCEFAQAINYPSPAAYRAVTINENGTVTLTKILQP